MKRAIKIAVKIVLVTVLLALVGIVALWYMIREPIKDEPDRFSNIPKTAVWRGGVDGGFWFDVVSVNVKKQTYRIKIYKDNNGELSIDADFFIKQDSCKARYALNKSILKYVSCFSFDGIATTNGCFLGMIKPGYGGSLSKIFKDINRNSKKNRRSKKN